MNFGSPFTTRLRRRLGLRAAVVAALLASGLLALAPVEAQTGRARMRGRAASERMAEARLRMDSIEKHFVSPQMVMRLRQEISLSEKQKQTLIIELQSAQSDLVPLRFEVQEAEEALSKMIQETHLDEKIVLQQAQRVMDLEAKARARHLVLLIRIKNLLTAKQQTMIQEIQRRHWANRAPRP